MKLKLLLIFSSVLIALLASFGLVLAQDRTAPAGATGESNTAAPVYPLASVGPGFTYQGQLNSSGNPVNGTCDFQFKLYDALVGGAQVGSMQTILAVNVVAGTFTVVLNGGGEFGPTAFTGEARYLAIAVRCPAGSGSYTNLTPRQPLSPAPYALSLKPEASISATITGTWIITDAGVLKVVNGKGGYCDWAAGVRATSGAGSTGFVFCDDVAFYGNGEESGVLGTGDLYGVAGVSQSSDGWGLFGRADGENGIGLNVRTYGENSYGIYAINYSTAITEGFGIYGVKGSTSGFDLLAHNWYPGAVVGDTNVGNGVVGLSSADYGIGVVGIITGTADRAVAGYAYSNINSSIGVYGESHATHGYGVFGSGEGSSAYGVYGVSYSTDGTGGYFTNASGSLNGWGVRAFTASGKSGDVHPGGWLYDAAGEFAGVNGLVGAASTDVNDGFGVVGISQGSGGVGVYGMAYNNGTAIYGQSSTYAGQFLGNVSVYGDLYASGAKPFRIDYPLDPANKYLYHYAVESPQVQNQYNGTVTLDANGEAVVDLPVYFSTVNTGPFQYQLTAIGAPGPNLYIAQEVTGNQFKIAGGTPGTKVSWLLFGLRNDPWIQDHPQTDVADKPAGEAGLYVYPQGYGQPATLQIGFLQQNNSPWASEQLPTIPPSQNNGTPGTTSAPQQPNNVPGSSTYTPQP